MKSGKKPSKNQSIFIQKNGYDSKNFLVERDTTELMVIINKKSKEVIEIYK